MSKSWELSKEEKRRVEKSSRDAINDRVAYMMYFAFVESQRNGFVSIMQFINDKINEMIDQGRISDMIEIRARIKAAQSAINNDDRKALDDIFGIEIITATENEISTLIQSLSQYMIKTKSKNYDKPNGYKAKHKYWTMKEDKTNYLKNYSFASDHDHIPMIEFQFKTAEVAIKCNNGGSADHTTYKGETTEEIQSKFDKGEFTLYNTPTMWVSRDGRMALLSKEETLKKIYPFLNTTGKKR